MSVRVCMCNSALYPDRDHNRNNRLVAFRYSDFQFSTTRGGPLAVSVHRSYNVEVKPSGLHYAPGGAIDSLWISEYAEPRALDPNGKESIQGAKPKYGAAPTTRKSNVGGGKRKRKPRPKTTKQPKARKPTKQRNRVRQSKLQFETEDDVTAVVDLKVRALHCSPLHQQCGWAVRQDLDPNSGLPDAYVGASTLDGPNVLVPDEAMFVGEGVRGFAVATQLGRKYGIIERCSYRAGYSCRIEFHRYDDLTLRNGGRGVILADHLVFQVVTLDSGLPPDPTMETSGGGTSAAPGDAPTSRKGQDQATRRGDTRKKRTKAKKSRTRRRKGTRGRAARKRKKQGKKPDTSVEQRNLGESTTLASSFRLPTGATGLAYRVSTTENFLMFLFSSAAQPYLPHVMVSGGDIEDGVHLMWLPGLATLPPAVHQNVIYVIYQQQCVQLPRTGPVLHVDCLHLFVSARVPVWMWVCGYVGMRDTQVQNHSTLPHSHWRRVQGRRKLCVWYQVQKGRQEDTEAPPSPAGVAQG